MVILIIAIILLPTLYVFSIGPVIGLVCRGMLPASIMPVAMTVYAPVGWLSSKCPPFEHFLGWYMMLWGFEMPVQD